MTAQTEIQQPFKLADACNSAGLSIQCSPPRGGVDETGDKAWPHIAYTVTLLRNGREVWGGHCKLGVGHVKAKGFTGLSWKYTTDEQRLLEHWQGKPSAQFTNKQLWADVAAKLAAHQKVAPKLADVLHSPLSDGAAYFDGLSFEDWCGEFGCDTDSRKAEETYRTCDAIGRKLQSALGRELVAQLREAAQDY